MSKEVEKLKKVMKFTQRANALNHAQAAYDKAFEAYFEILGLLHDEQFWRILEVYRKNVIRFRLQYGRTNGVEHAADELMRAASDKETPFYLREAICFVKTYKEVTSNMASCVPENYIDGNSYDHVVDNLPLCGKINKGTTYRSIQSFESAITMSVSDMEMEDELADKFVKFLMYGENHHQAILKNAAKKYILASIQDMSCIIGSDPRYLSIDVDRDTLATVLDETDGPMTVQTKLDDEGLVLDILDSEGEVIDSAWQLYAVAGVKVIPESTQ